jgi:hypothetical protein
LVIAGGILVAIGPMAIAGGIYKSFDSLKINESAGIGAVGGGLLELALIGAIVSVTGLLLLIAGAVIFVVKRAGTKPNNYI